MEIADSVLLFQASSIPLLAIQVSGPYEQQINKKKSVAPVREHKLGNEP